MTDDEPEPIYPSYPAAPEGYPDEPIYPLPANPASAPAPYPAGARYPPHAPYQTPDPYPAQPPYPGYPGSSRYPPYPGYPLPVALPVYGPMTPPGGGRPASATAAAVLTFVAAGLLLLASLVLQITAGTDDVEIRGVSAKGEIVLDGILDQAVALVFIVGGVLVLRRRVSGRGPIFGATATTVVLGIYWLTRFDDNTPLRTGVAVLYVAVAVAAAWLGSTSATVNWLRPGSARDHQA